eukprot:scaffold2703_cov129-Isochrysis_galbana.AAC.6
MVVSPNWEGTGKINFLREDRRSSNEKKEHRPLIERPVLSSLPLLALKAQWQAPETGHGPHRRDVKVFDKSAQTSQQTSTLCSSGFLEPRTSKIYLLAGPLAQKGHWQVPETGHGPHRRSFQDLRQIFMSPAQTSTLSSSGFWITGLRKSMFLRSQQSFPTVC